MDQDTVRLIKMKFDAIATGNHRKHKNKITKSRVISWHQ